VDAKRSVAAAVCNSLGWQPWMLAAESIPASAVDLNTLALAGGSPVHGWRTWRSA
jgi:hypothetical protein